MGMGSFAAKAIVTSALAFQAFTVAAEEAPTKLLRSDAAAEVEAPTKLLRSRGAITITNGGVKDPKGLMGVGHFVITEDGQVKRKPVVPGFHKK